MKNILKKVGEKFFLFKICFYICSEKSKLVENEKIIKYRRTAYGIFMAETNCLYERFIGGLS
ncbi:hypothetical protein CCAN11_2140020 [Capnocytophaga canimorsus]|uniref:Uncharacterized protein n=1 Tax=Capnocytophaga canimorsus TaxID=28188 RepID=A0A0B7IK91_9FLAO|nr:hypothetical protein CCAN11_2140020 [Capnocytophaga canimorsus]